MSPALSLHPFVSIFFYSTPVLMIPLLVSQTSSGLHGGGHIIRFGYPTPDSLALAVHRS